MIITHLQPFLFRLCLGLLVLPLPAWASGISESEAALKTAFVYNFTQFITWPVAPANTPFRLCVLSAKRELREQFNRLNGKTANHRVIKLVFLHRDFTTTELQSCQLVFQPKPSPPVLSKPLPRGVVLVAYNPKPNNPNVSISMQSSRARLLRFSINQAAVAVAGVKISSQLLKLAINKQETH